LGSKTMLSISAESLDWPQLVKLIGEVAAMLALASLATKTERAEAAPAMAARARAVGNFMMVIWKDECEYEMVARNCQTRKAFIWDDH
jgi:hypothetical protein